MSLLRPIGLLPVVPHVNQAAERLADLRFPEQRLEAMGILRQFVHEARLRVCEAHMAGASGIATARQLATTIDQVIVECHDFLARSPLFSQRQRSPRVAIVAVGGYGRGDLNPFSDLDIVVLHAPQADEISTQFMLQFTYFLMDMRLDVRYSNRSVANCVQMARRDLSTKTSFIEARPLAGDGQLLEQFRRTVQRELLGKGVDQFIGAKTEERQRRHDKYYGSVSVLEPNVKESPGGLRDYHTTLWVGAMRVGARSVEELEAAGVITAAERQAVTQAYDFLLRVRTDLHFAQQWKSDVLALEVQEDTAVRLGFGGNGTGLPVERFMREYYRQARVVNQLCASALNRCRPHERGIGKVLEYMLRKELDHGLVVARGEITAKERGSDPFQARPSLLLEVFAWGLEMDLGLSDDLKGLMRANLGAIDDAFRADQQHSRLFMTILKHPHAARALRAMHEIGILSAYLPEFEPITGLVHHDLYHKYTVDEHTLRAVDYLDELPETPEKELREIAKLFQSLPNPEVLRLALLYHDVGKTKGIDHVEESAELFRAAAPRLGLGEKRADQVELLVKNHLLMNHLAQRRDITDPKIVADFAETVRNVENLKLLCILTYADTRAVGPDIWTVWKGALLWELYMRTYKHFTQEDEVVVTGEALIEQVKSEVMSALSGRIPDAVVDAFFKAMPYKYIVSTAADTMAHHVQLVEGLKGEKLATKHTHHLELGSSELMICTPSKAGNFSKIAGTLAANKLNILGAQIYTRSDGLALYTLQIESLEKKPILDERLWQRLKAELATVLAEEREVTYRPGRTIFARKERAVPVTTVIEVNNRISDMYTVIDVTTQDRLGLLYLITTTLFELGINIHLAKVSTEATRAIDVFYVTDLLGEKIVDEHAIEDVRSRLQTVLDLDER
ncbi:MAG TPA: [protein-PII] uridylyltransferase [Candidatus Tectomicrobia bacterium]|nr:[protein-PII] uridylyltransferase [Candidatus Tectomicrobia bacterium]